MFPCFLWHFPLWLEWFADLAQWQSRNQAGKNTQYFPLLFHLITVLEYYNQNIMLIAYRITV